MLSIIYPEGDYTSANIAVKVQALAQGQGKKVYIVPKHYGRNDENVFSKLKKSSTALFLSYDKSITDNNTNTELNFLLQNGKPIYAIVPKDMKILISAENNNEIHTYPYSQNNQASFAESMQKFIGNLSEEKSSKPQRSDFNMLMIVGALILSILYLGLVLKNDKR